MAKDLSDFALAVTPAVTQRTLENLRRTLEDMYVRSTAQDATPEDVAAFTPELIAQAHEVAMQDNARMIVAWAKAIHDQLHSAIDTQNVRIQIATERDKLLYYKKELEELEAGTIYQEATAQAREQQKGSLAKAVQRSEKELSRLAQDLRAMSQSQTAVPRRPPHTGPWETSPGYEDLDGTVPPMS
jgi:uncharacterized coiled-coil protein SlyX